MSYNSKITIKSVLIVAAFLGFTLLIQKQNKDQARAEILEQCQNGKSVTINDIEIHCGVISSKSIKEWNDE
jgi:preprotein translocase subunit YajC